MPKKYKITGFARFVIVMLFIAPIAFLAASYYNGEDGIQNLKDFLGWGEEQKVEQVQEAPVPDSTTKTEIVTTPPEGDTAESAESDTTVEAPAASVEEIQDLQQELTATKEELEEMKSENYDLLKALEEKDAEIKRLQEQLANQADTSEVEGQ